MKTLGSLTFLSIFLCCFFTLQLKAQETDNGPIREIGAGLRNFSDDFSLIYKEQIGENKYRRYSGSLSLAVGGEVNFMGISFSLGTENRVFLDDQLKFVHGLGYGLSLQTNFETESGGLNSITPFVNYQLGIQYDIKDNFYVGASTFPSFILIFNSAQDYPTAVLNVNLSAQVSAIFRF